MPCATLVTALFLILAVFQLQCRQRFRVCSKYSDTANLRDTLEPTIFSPLTLVGTCPLQPNKRLDLIFGLGNSLVSAEAGVRK